MYIHHLLPLLLLPLPPPRISGMSIFRVISPAPSSFPFTLSSFLARSVLLPHGPLVRRLFVVALDRDSSKWSFQ